MSEKIKKILKILVYAYLAFLGFTLLKAMWYVRGFWMLSTFVLAVLLSEQWGSKAE